MGAPFHDPIVFALIFVIIGLLAGLRRPEPTLLQFVLLEQKVDAIMAHLGIEKPTPDEEIDCLICAGLRINAIRRYREHYGGGLKDSKDAVERRARELESAQVRRSAKPAASPEGAVRPGP